MKVFEVVLHQTKDWDSELNTFFQKKNSASWHCLSTEETFFKNKITYVLTTGLSISKSKDKRIDLFCI